MKQISATELKKLMDEGKAPLLIDVREDFERELFTIGGQHHPMSQFNEWPEIAKDQPVILYCEKGIRSTIIIQRLESLGHTNLINLSGGMKAWKEQNL